MYWIKIDKTEPTLSFVKIDDSSTGKSGGGYYNGSVVHYKCTDSVSGASSVEAHISNNNDVYNVESTSSSEIKFKMNYHASGSKQTSFTCKDKAGNKVSAKPQNITCKCRVKVAKNGFKVGKIAENPGSEWNCDSTTNHAEFNGVSLFNSCQKSPGSW